MLRQHKLLLIIIFISLSLGLLACSWNKSSIEDNIISYTIDPKSKDIAFYWKDDNGKKIQSIGNLKTFVESKNQKLIFAMNGGMFNASFSPQGLFIEQFDVLTPLDTCSGNGNFYLKPNGVFYITEHNKPVICKTEEFKNNNQIKFATQSGPMLIIDGEIHPAFTQGSNNIHIRNGVGILPDNKVIFAISKNKINFYDFASYFKSLGCKNALYLDGYVSRTYLPEKDWIQTDGNLGVIIGVTEVNKN